MYIHSQQSSCQTLFWHPHPEWPTSWANTCKLGSSYQYLWKECWVESPSGILLDGKKPDGCAVWISSLPSIDTATGLAKVLEEPQNRAGKARSAARVCILPNLPRYLCFLHAKTELYWLIARWLGATIPTEKTNVLVRDREIPFHWIKHWKYLNCNSSFGSSQHIKKKRNSSYTKTRQKL